MRRSAVLAPLLGMVVLTFAVAPAHAACAISLSVEPAKVNYPFQSLPQPGDLGFALTADVNYSASQFANKTVELQVLAGSSWVKVLNFTGNKIGFTEVSYSLTDPYSKFGQNLLRATSGGCTSAPALIMISYDPGAIGVDAALYSALAVIGMAGYLLRNRVSWKAFVFLGGAAYLVVAPFTGQRYDVYFLLSSGIRILQHVNPFNPGAPPAYPTPLKWAYPPLYSLYSALSFSVYRILTGSALPSVASLTYPGWLTSTYSVFKAFEPGSLPVLVFLLKIPMVASAVMTGVILRWTTGKDSSVAVWLGNPLVILVASVWGQLDPIATMFAVAAVHCHLKNKRGWALFFASWGAAVKLWPALLIPVMLVSSRSDGWKAVRRLLAVVPAALATIGIYSVFGSLSESLFVLAYSRGIPVFSGAFTVNGLTWQEILLVMKATPVPIFLLVGIPLYALSLIWIYVKKEDNVVKWGIVSILLFYLTYNYVNPQYFYWIVPFFMIQGRKVEAAVTSLLPIVYVALSYNLFYFVSPSLLPDEFATGAAVLEQIKVTYFYQMPGVFVATAAIIPTVAYLWILRREIRVSFQGNRQRTDRKLHSEEMMNNTD